MVFTAISYREMSIVLAIARGVIAGQLRGPFSFLTLHVAVVAYFIVKRRTGRTAYISCRR